MRDRAPAGGALSADAARAGRSGRCRRPSAGAGLIAVVSAGTADIPVAEEAALTAELRGQPRRTGCSTSAWPACTGCSRTASEIERPR